MNTKKVVIAMGSPRKKGNSATLAYRVAEGAKAAGADVESFYLHEMDIKPCNACDICREDTAIDCNINDDMEGLSFQIYDPWIVGYGFEGSYAYLNPDYVFGHSDMRLEPEAISIIRNTFGIE